MKKLLIVFCFLFLFKIPVINQVLDIREYAPGSCTVFSISSDTKVFFGNNEDYIDLPLYYWVEPTTDSTYGGLFFGFKINNQLITQGGINEKGLVYDFMALPPRQVKPSRNLPPRQEVFTRIMQQCATVDELIKYTKKYNWEGSISYQVHFADKNGDGTVLSVGKEGYVTFTIKDSDKNYLLSTNFNLADTSNHFPDSYPCWRYTRADNLLSQICTDSLIDEKHLRYILDATHIESGLGNTLYSQVYNITDGLIYLYYWHQYYEYKVLDLSKELKSETKPTLIKSLFSDELLDRVEKEYNYYKNNNIN